MTSKRRADLVYGLLIAALFVAQALHTLAGLHRLWYEELAEGIRNPFWLDHRLVYDGVSSNVGWYGLVLLVYKVFGFSTYAAKYVRLALHVPFLVCSALLLRRSLGLRRAWLPLVAFGLSPTLLYFNSLGTSYAIDVQLFPIVLWLIVRVGDRAHAGRLRLAIRHSVVGGLAMLACLMFPSFLFYLPFLLVVHLSLNRPALAAARFREGLLWMTAGFLAPFGVASIYLRNAGAFLSDGSVHGAGVFRGGGQALTFDPAIMAQTLAQLLRDLFFGGHTYYFAIPYGEFSGVLGLAAAAGILFGSVVVAWNWQPARQPLVLAGLLCVASLAGVTVTGHLPGLRRSTGFVSGVYVAVACVWAVPFLRGTVLSFVVRAARLACLLLIAQHLSVYGSNYQYLAAEARAMHDPWFSRFGSPETSVATWARERVLLGKPLDCRVLASCRYSEIYPAVAGYLRWNGLGEPPVLATDPDSGRVIQLTLQYRETRPVGQ